MLNSCLLVNVQGPEGHHFSLCGNFSAGGGRILALAQISRRGGACGNRIEQFTSIVYIFAHKSITYFTIAKRFYILQVPIEECTDSFFSSLLKKRVSMSSHTNKMAKVFEKGTPFLSLKYRHAL